MPRAGLYARYSTDNQRPTSIEDQFRLDRARAAAEGLDVVATYADDEISGFMPIESRAGSSKLMLDVAAGRFDVLIIEALDRFSRNLVDQERMVRRLEFLGLRIIGVVDGYDSAHEGREMMRAVRGSFNEQLLRDIAKKTHRGLAGQVTRGYHAGGISYGYRSVIAATNAKGEPIGHRLEVDAGEAEHVRWIFAQFAQGSSCQKIVSALNRERVPAPHGGTWAVSALYGSPVKGSGVLNNEVYIGRYLWNRSRWIKDPDTGKRKRFDRPREEWMIEERPELAIVPLELWQQVRERMERPRANGGAQGRGAKPRTLFGGLLRCGRCGGAVIAVNANRYGCAARKDRGETVCAGILVPRRPLDARLLALVRQDLLEPESALELQRQVERLLGERRREHDRATGGAKARAAELEREIRNLVDGVAAFGPSEALRARLGAAEAERSALAAARKPIAPGRPVSGLLARYKRLLVELQGAMEKNSEEGRELLRDVLGEVRLVSENNGEVYAEVGIRTERLLLAAAGGSYLGLVAGTCFVTQIRRIRVK